MTILYLLVPLGLALCALAVWAFFWAVNAGQFDELDAAAVSPLEDDPVRPSPSPSSPDEPPSAWPSSP
ncbi:MAG: cbb3-type cytochrome oxidase assembly protein CcoS [Gammaproteobacteria bacterium]|nr:cbb3-type cytochrome oxidase assembly protein CcoS [Gammaproteobacteria bacterium]